MTRIDVDNLDSLGIGFRPANKTDVNFILNSWMKSMRNNWIYSIEDPDIYYTITEEHIRTLLDRCGCVVAYNVKSPDDIYGWICGEYWEKTLIVHYIFVKKAFRMLGIAKIIYDFVKKDTDIIMATSATKAFCEIQKKSVLSILYNPFFIYKLATLETIPFCKGIIE